MLLADGINPFIGVRVDKLTVDELIYVVHKISLSFRFILGLKNIYIILIRLISLKNK